MKQLQALLIPLVLSNCGPGEPDYRVKDIDVFINHPDNEPTKEDLKTALNYWTDTIGGWANMSVTKSDELVRDVSSITITDKILENGKNKAVGLYYPFSRRIEIYWNYGCWNWDTLFHELMHHVLLYEVDGDSDGDHNYPGAWEEITRIYTVYSVIECNLKYYVNNKDLSHDDKDAFNGHLLEVNDIVEE